ncbi:MAG: ABC transporter permease [bacterium]
MHSRIIPIIRKEFIHISRDFRTLVIVIAMPVVMLFLYGYAINMEIQNIELVVVDHDQSPASRALIQKFEGSEFFTVSYFDGPESQLESLFAKRICRMILILSGDFAKNLQRQPKSAVQVLIDASDPNAAQAIRNYSSAIFQTYNLQHGFTPAVEIESSIWYNPERRSAYFFVPGLAALILIMISALLTSIAIVREKETGTLEQILVSPIRPGEIIIGKVAPYLILSFLDFLIILAIARYVFNVPFVGNFALLLFSTLTFISVGLSLGLFISTIAQTQQVAMMVALVSTMLPTVMLSGFIFPLSSLPLPLQIFSHIVPARYFLVVIRGVMLKGNSLVQVLPEVTILAGVALAFLVMSAKKFQTTLEGVG